MTFFGFLPLPRVLEQQGGNFGTAWDFCLTIRTEDIYENQKILPALRQTIIKIAQ